MRLEELKELEKSLNENGAYIASSIDGKGTHIGRFIGLSLDANDNIVIQCDIDKESITK